MPGSAPLCSHFSWVLGEPRVSGIGFVRRTEKGPIGISLITIPLLLGLMRQLLAFFWSFIIYLFV